MATDVDTEIGVDSNDLVEGSLVDTRFEIINEVKVGFGFIAFGRAIPFDSVGLIGKVCLSCFNAMAIRQ